MADHSTSARVCALFDSALQTYEKKVGVALIEHPLAVQLQSCHSVESITNFLQDQVQAFSDFRESDRGIKSIERTVSVLTRLSATTSPALDIGLPLAPVKIIHIGLAILLAAAKAITASYDPLVDLLESIENILNRLDIFTLISPTSAMVEMVVKIMVELLSTLALATRQLKQGQSIKSVRNVFGTKGVRVEAVLERLDRLTQDEVRTTVAEILRVIYSLIQNLTVIMDGDEVSSDGVREVLETLHQTTSNKNRPKRNKLQMTIQGWLAPPDPWKNYNIAKRSRHSGAGTWFVQDGMLSEWTASGPSSLLWIQGKPGAGKSVLCSAIIDEIEVMRKSGLASLAFYYHDFREDQKKDLRGLLSSVLFQLCAQSDCYYDIISRFYSTHHGARKPSNDELLRALKELLESPGQALVYVIIDGLDECPNTSKSPMRSPREEVLKLLEQLAESRLENLRLCVTSQPETDIKTVLEPLTFRSISIHDERGQMNDIENYIRSVVNMDPMNRTWKQEDKELVTNILTEHANGIFLWVYCQLVHLRGCHPGRIRHALAELPKTLDETYERTLREINKADRGLAHWLLQCVAVASRPFRVEELAEFLAFDFQAGPIPKFREEWRIEDPIEAVLSTCLTLLSLVNVDGSEVIQFSHFSVKEFLMSSRFAQKCDAISHRFHISMTPAHTFVTQACLGILLHLDENITQDALRAYPLTEYAAGHWMEHVRFEDVSENAEEGMKQLFDPSKRHLAVWVWIWDPTCPGHSRSGDERPRTPIDTPLHYAAFCGLDRIVKFLVIEHSQDVHSHDAYRRPTPLHHAAMGGHAEVAHVLLEHGADVTAQDTYGWTPLHYASYHGHVDPARLFVVEKRVNVMARDRDDSTPLHRATNFHVSRFLIEHGADVTAQNEYGWTPLHSAVDVDVARLLVDHGAKVTARDKNGWTPLHWAADVDVARFLVDHGADVTAQDKDGCVPLHEASLRGYGNVARFLVEHGADVTAQNEDGLTPLHRASLTGHLDLAQFLVEHGADATAGGKEGLTPLHEASRGYSNSVDLALFLIKQGADATARNKGGSTPLHQASIMGNVDLARLLIEHGASATAQDKDGLTPLHQASIEGHVDLARFLIEHGADMTARENNRRTPLHEALIHSHVDLARFLIEHGADATAQCRDGSTPLLLVSISGYENLALLLIEHGADVTTPDEDGWTALHEASRGGHLDLARVLVEHGADVTARDNNELTPLHCASLNGEVALARFLIGHGANATAQRDDGSTPLHLASCNGSVDLARLLVELGAKVTAQDKEGSTPLQYALNRCAEENADVTRFLVERGADVTAHDKEGKAPLHYAAEMEDVDLARFLVEHGADVSDPDNDGWTPLHHASMNGPVNLVQFLVEHGADVIARDNYWWTPLRHATIRGDVDVVQILFEHGADVITPDNDGWTPLFHASHWGNLELVQFLVEQGATALTQAVPQIKRPATT